MEAEERVDIMRETFESEAQSRKEVHGHGLVFYAEGKRKFD